MSLLGDLGTAIKNKLGGTSVDNTVPRYDGTTCKLQGSGVTISDTNVVTASGGFVGSLTGNASTATTLQTARTINGVAFDGTANITIADSTKLPLAGGTLTGALAGTTFTGTSFNSITGLSSTTPVMNGTAAVGTGTTAARADHVHGSDTTKVSKVTSTDNAIVRFDGTSGAVQNSSVIIDDNGSLGVGSTPFAKLSTIVENNGIAETVFMAGILGVTNGFTILKDSVSNPIYRFHTTSGVTGLEIDSSGNLLLKSGTGALGYGAGAGGTVTQLTSKSTAVTLNKPCGTIITSNSTLASGASVSFTVYNNLVTVADLVYVYGCDYSYFIQITADNTTGDNGMFNIRITNNTGMNFPRSLVINFVIIKGART